MFRQRTAVMMLAAGLVAAPAHAQFVRSGGQTTTSCGAITVTLCDLNWSVQWFNLSGGIGGFFANAPIITSTIPGPWAPNTSQQQWIGAANNATVGSPSRYYYQTTFTSPVSSVISFGLGWDNKLVGAYVGGSIDPATGLFLEGVSLLGATSPSNPYAGGRAGFCRDSDGVFRSDASPNCVLNVAIGVNAEQMNTLTFVVEGDGETDGLLVGTAAGSNEPPVIQVPPTTAPEPATMGLMFMGLVALGGVRYLKRGSPMAG
jgi:PEP-CTERM motif-containing protein